METAYYCPKCGGPLQVMAACGSTSYFCQECKGLVSSKKVLTKEQVENQKQEHKEKE